MLQQCLWHLVTSWIKLSACIISIKLELGEFLFNTNTHAFANVTDHYNGQQKNMNISDQIRDLSYKLKTIITFVTNFLKTKQPLLLPMYLQARGIMHSFKIFYNTFSIEQTHYKWAMDIFLTDSHTYILNFIMKTYSKWKFLYYDRTAIPATAICGWHADCGSMSATSAPFCCKGRSIQVYTENDVMCNLIYLFISEKCRNIRSLLMLHHTNERSPAAVNIKA